MIDGRSQPAFEQLSDTNRGPWIIVAAFIFLLSTLPAVVVKIWTRAATQRKLIHTDWTIIASYAFTVGQTIALTLAVTHGLGSRIEELSESDLQTVTKAFYASGIIRIPALAFAKASVILLIVSIQARGNQIITNACYGLLGITAAWMIAGMFSLAFQCELPHPWALGSQNCIDQNALRIALGSIDVVTDLAVIGLAILMMRPVQVPFSKKLAVVAMFGTRIAVPPFTICALVSYQSYYGHPEDRTWYAFGPSIWTQVALNLSIITACIPSMKRFLADIQSGLMGATISESYEMTHSSGKAAPQISSMSGSGIRSVIASKLGINTNRMRMTSTRQSEKDTQHSITPVDDWYAPRSEAKSGKTPYTIQETESVKGLTNNVIHQRIDYDVEYEERGMRLSESRVSDRKGDFEFQLQ